MTTTANDKQNATTTTTTTTATATSDQADDWPLVWNLAISTLVGGGFIALVWWLVVATVGQ
jgi:hypothetical protein